ncbi:MAG: molybdate ABC transporter permease subunit [Bacteroidota bacterium]|nr:molybdate ABC transporter permease subunit [Bacteroidota bacterium]MDP4247742.1 molybdate ABC transporter permease subunit [Bacteroidota bacterium]MDP4260171.1 molybdate ABC transporter permease subunit [Bacteroidota bacterium]
MTDMAPIWLSFRLSLVTTAVLLLIAVPLANWLAHSRFRLKVVAETIISLPLVLPPTVLGFYLLLAFSPSNAFGQFLDRYLGLRLVFSFPGLVIASVLYSLPFMVNPLLAGFRALPSSLREASATLGKSGAYTLLNVLLPNIRGSLLTGIVLSFAHTMGEFGVVLMIGGNIPGKTRVASLALYDEVQSLNYHAANRYALILFASSFMILLLVYLLNHHFSKANPLP